ncbi:endonuclease/exonuclease/phosphatase family protein [Streptomyces sp. NPDC058665]|uniref:endonuclease/exonuclease/phosphatase family protein n=1 Tax=Streptomyces sp. NPDC058665 TaxID=3346586 RepID=UPI0036605925
MRRRTVRVVAAVLLVGALSACGGSGGGGKGGEKARGQEIRGQAAGSAQTYTVTTFKDLPGYTEPGAGEPTGTLRAGENYVYCKVGGPRVQEGDAYNSWWLRTDLDTGSTWRGQYVSAFGLAKWDDDEAKDVNGAEIPDCGATGPPDGEGGGGDEVGGGEVAKSTYVVGQFNMAGGHATWSKKAGGPAAFVASVRTRKPAFVTIQESCDDWNRLVETGLDLARAKDSAVPEYDIAFRQVRHEDEPGGAARCKHPEDPQGRAAFGTAILYRTDLGFDQGPAAPHDLETPEGGEHRQMQCVTSQRINTVVCTAHLTKDGGDAEQVARRHEASVAKGILRDSYGAYTRFVGLDMNDDPMSGTADHFYHPDYGNGAQGELKELFSHCGNDIRERPFPAAEPCRGGERTHDSLQKIDYIFASPHVEHVGHDVNDAHSDHRVLWATVRF